MNSRITMVQPEIHGSCTIAAAPALARIFVSNIVIYVLRSARSVRVFKFPLKLVSSHHLRLAKNNLLGIPPPVQRQITLKRQPFLHTMIGMSIGLSFCAG